MAEELYFLKTNPLVAKINLYNKLCNEEEDVLRFLNGDKKINLELIKDKLQDSIEYLSPDELRQLFNWFKFQYASNSVNGTVNNNEEVKTQLYVNGIDLFHEIPSALTKPFDRILNDYENANQCSLEYISDAEKFNKFLLYGLFYTSLAQEDDEEKRILVDYLKSQHPAMYEAAQAEFKEKIGKTGLTEDLNSKGIILFDNFSELYDSTKFYKGSIIQINSD
ncbi:hypothetical protein [Chryseobacterium taiwanense]|uniref:Uncharacterized protein n=1 Tax=Chryseobacterium taiwanense TaxID=363331 RepID=A0A0B4E9Q1_9FLAO|nr:hypothetical protein [Chryseobacterium taiwanense]KIC63358.1 hypothetical protein RM51_06670 [Chryseobacterium taiwanense]